MVSALIVNSLIFQFMKEQKIYKSIFLSGILGFVVAPIVYSFDVGKIKNQTLTKLNYYDYFFQRTDSQGREMVGFGVYFNTYSYLKEFHPLISGGIGLCNWTASYPIDVIKNNKLPVILV